MSQVAHGQTVEPAESKAIAIEVRAEEGDLDFFGRFMCNINSVCSFALNDLRISFFPVESFIGVTVRTNDGATHVTDLRGREDLSFEYDELTQSIPLYSVNGSGHMKEAGLLKVRASRS